MIHIGIDLDNTLINIQETCDKSTWEIKKGVCAYLPMIYARECFVFHLITARSSKTGLDDTIRYIEGSLKIKFESVTMTHQTKKGKYAKKKNCAFMIDDNPEYMSNCLRHSVVPILLKTPKHKYQRMFKQYFVFDNWKEIYEYFKLFEKHSFNSDAGIMTFAIQKRPHAIHYINSEIVNYPPFILKACSVMDFGWFTHRTCYGSFSDFAQQELKFDVRKDGIESTTGVYFHFK